jgi:hypothetical protein
MRYIILAILVYLVYLVLKFFVKLYLRASSSGVKGENKKKKHSKIDVDKIEEADYEEIKTPEKEK